MNERYAVRSLVDGTFGIMDFHYTINGRPAPYLCWTGIEDEAVAQSRCNTMNRVNDGAN